MSAVRVTLELIASMPERVFEESKLNLNCQTIKSTDQR